MSQSQAYATPIHFTEWLEAIKPQLKPPVGNKLMFGDGQQKVMIVGGPNQREDYHIEEGEVCKETPHKTNPTPTSPTTHAGALLHDSRRHDTKCD